MKHYISIFICTATILCATTHNTQAQISKTAYFIENATHRYLLNPALQPSRGYVSVPALGSVNLNFSSNAINAKNMFRPYGPHNALVLFLHPSFSAQELLSPLKSQNKINTRVDLSLLSSGFYTKAGYFNIDISLRAMQHSNIPKTLFEFAKVGIPEGAASHTYTFSDLNIQARSYVDISTGYSKALNDNLTVGARFKFLLGVGDTRIHYNSITANLSDEQWNMQVDGYADATMAGLYPTYSPKDGYIDGVSYDGSDFKIAGFGSGIDLGVVYSLKDITGFGLLDNLTLSAAANDLGFIRWKKQHTTKALGTGNFDFDGFQLDFSDDSDIPSVSDQMNDIEDRFLEMLHLKQQAAKARTTALQATLNLGAEYALFENKLGVGLLSSTRIGHHNSFSELTLSGNYRPLSWLALSLSYGFVHSRFQTFGWAINMSPSWINFFIASDYMVTKVGKPFVPLTNSLDLQFGLSVPLTRKP